MIDNRFLLFLFLLDFVTLLFSVPYIPRFNSFLYHSLSMFITCSLSLGRWYGGDLKKCQHIWSSFRLLLALSFAICLSFMIYRRACIAMQ